MSLTPHVVLATILFAPGCGASLAGRWDETERSALDERFSSCNFIEDEEHDAVGWECGLIMYTVMRGPGEETHEATVERVAKLITEDGIFAYESQKKALKPMSWDGDELSATAIIFEPPAGTILQPMVEVVTSHVRDGQRLAYTCLFPGIISEELVAKATVECLDAEKALHAATR